MSDWPAPKHKTTTAVYLLPCGRKIKGIVEMKLPQDYRYLTQIERRAVREEYVRIQEGKCHHCKEPLTGNPATEVLSKPVKVRLFPKGFFTYPVHLHHSHETGMTIGAVHNLCNAVLWQYHGE